MELGAFSVSLAVKDIAASREFYEKLGFSVFGGDQAQRWLIMKCGTTLIGLFQGMFEKNMLTFTFGALGAATIGDDATVRVVAGAKNDAYTVELPLEAGKYSALRLETLPHASLPVRHTLLPLHARVRQADVTPSKGPGPETGIPTRG